MSESELLTIAIAAGGAVSAFLFADFYRRSKATQRGRDAATSLRNQFFSLTPEQVDSSYPQTDSGVWAAAMDLGVERGAGMLVALNTGDASIYFSTGGGVVGGSAHEAVRDAAIRFVDLVDQHSVHLSAGHQGPFPGPSRVRFYALCRSGVLVSEELPESELSGGSHALSSCFLAAHEVIGRLRLSRPS